MTDRPIRAALYARVSTARQAEADLSIPDQVKQLQAYCDRKGWEVAEIYIEPGASALDDDRPVFQDMIAAATGVPSRYDHIVVHSLSRFSRDALHSELYIRKLLKAGVSLVSITQELSNDSNGNLIRQIFNAFDEHQSRENAKHTHRAMMENARQGFWNGARPPFGYSVVVKERRGNKDKKVLVIDEVEAPIVRLIFDLYLGRHGCSRGVKGIVNYLNERGILRRGRKWGIGSLHDLMTAPTYCGRHLFNQLEARTRRRRSASECVEMAVPAIVSVEDFDRVQTALQERSPRKTPPRVVNGPTLLAGVARCGHCNSAMILNTGKGVYRYYACSKAMKQGKTACQGQRIRMDRLDDLVLDYLGSRIFDPERLCEMLRTYMEAHETGAAARKERLRQLRERLGEVQAGRTRLLNLVETGAIEPDDPTLKERLLQLKMQANDLEAERTSLQASLSAGAPRITPDRIDALVIQMRERFRSGPPELRQAYMRLLLEKVEVGPGVVTLCGSNTILERLATNGATISVPEVLSFVREWRPGRDSNP